VTGMGPFPGDAVVNSCGCGARQGLGGGIRGFRSILLAAPPSPAVAAHDSGAPPCHRADLVGVVLLAQAQGAEG